MCSFRLFALLSLLSCLPTAFAEAHCPGNVASVYVRHTARLLTVVPVEINRTGSYDFIVDTGSQLTMIDPKLASELHLQAEGTAGIDSLGFHARTT